ncbi:MAG: ABC transporter ATP-binding protein [Acidimicrobiales bacterium]
MTGRATWRGLRMLVSCSPLGMSALLAAQVVEGVAPSAVLAAMATLVDQAPHWSQSASARSATEAAVAVVGAALVATQAVGSWVYTLSNLIGYRFGAAVDALRLEAIAALPGLAHFDTPALADGVEAGGWAAAAGRLPGTLSFMLRFATLVVSAGVVASRLAWWAPVLLTAASVPGTVNNWRHARARTSMRKDRVRPGRYAAYHRGLALDLQPARELRLFGLGTWLRQRQAQTWAEATRPILVDSRRHFGQNLVAAVAKMGVAALPIAFSFTRLDNHQLSVGDFAAGVLALVAMIPALSQLESSPGEARERVRFLPDLFDLAETGRRDPRLDTSGTLAPPARPARGIAFEGVRFTYPGAPAPALDGVDLWLAAGTALALVGENGAGKSTLVKLLCRMYDPDEGRITCDGVDIATYHLPEWRRRLAVVFQDFTRLPLSAAENVGIGAVDHLPSAGAPPGATPAATLPGGLGDLLAGASARSGADSVVARLPDGWGTVLAREFGGVDLSGGEWQRIALARAMAGQTSRGASVLVLDEPTAALDVRLEDDLYRRFAALTKGLTTLVISHRFSTVRMAGQVAVLERGRVVEVGSHDELVARSGRYAELFALQAARFDRGAAQQ